MLVYNHSVRIYSVLKLRSPVLNGLGREERWKDNPHVEPWASIDDPSTKRKRPFSVALLRGRLSKMPSQHRTFLPTTRFASSQAYEDVHSTVADHETPLRFSAASTASALFLLFSFSAILASRSAICFSTVDFLETSASRAERRDSIFSSSVICFVFSLA